MKVTKYPQSAFIVEEAGRRILIDPGIFLSQKFNVEDLPSLDAILITHQHADHLDPEFVSKLIEKEIPLYSNQDVVDLLQGHGFEINKLENDKEFEIAGFKIKVIDIPHCKLLYCSECGKTIGENMTPGKKCRLHPDIEPQQVDGPPNTGFVINSTLFHPGDGIELEGLESEKVALPIAGPTIEYDRAWKFATSLRAKTIIPMHYSNPLYAVDPNEFAKLRKTGAKVIVLNDGESAEL